MSIFLKRICLGAFIAFPLLLKGESQDQMLADLDSIKHAFQVSYAPAQWKSNYSGWDLNAETEKAKAEILSSKNMTTKDFQRLVKKFLGLTKDYHVNVLFYSTEKATLPFRVKGANGKYFISSINRNKLSYSSFPFSEGDEVLLFDGRPVHEVVNELMSAEINSNEQTDRALAEIFLTLRSGLLGHEVPKGTITLTLLPKDSAKVSSYQLIWNYKQEKIASLPRPPHKILPIKNNHAKSLRKLTPNKNSANSNQTEIFNDPIFQKLLLVSQFEDILDGDDEGDKPSDFMGSRSSFIPALGRLWWQTSEDCPFHAYLFELPDHKLGGYIRIPSYMPTGNDDLLEFAKIISFLQDRSEALVIDQVDNPGGSVFYLYALTSMLTDQPLITPRHRMTITQSDVFTAYKMIPIFEAINSDAQAQDKLGDSFGGIPVTHQLAQFMLNFFRFIIDEWNAGRQLTEPYFLYGIDHINPHPYARYTKPILVLVNCLDFSGGDFFPAILQDNQRVTVMGSRTAGAGGFISRLKFPNLNGIAEIRFTGSIAERLDKSPIENLGVRPDLPYEITENDIRYGYSQYADAIREALKRLIE